MHAATSVRTLSRRLKAVTGTTPLQWMLHVRIRRAQTLLERTTLSVAGVAERVGFESASTLRDAFVKRIGTTLIALSSRFRCLIHPDRAASLGAGT